MLVMTEKKLLKVLGIAGDKDSKVSELKKEIEVLKSELSDLKLKKTMEEREITHLVKLKEEKQKVEFERKEIELQKKFQEKEMELMKQFHNKTLELLDKKADELGKIHTEILGRLPNITMAINKKG